MSAREEILETLRRVRERREAVEHPGRFGGWRPDPPPRALDGFVSMFTQAGGEVVHFANAAERKEWLRVFLLDYDSVSMGAGVPSDLAGLGGPPRVALGKEHTAPVGISWARAAVAETGSLLMDARDGRRAQLLPPVLVALVEADSVYSALADALEAVGPDMSAALGMHSGPSKSADIGQVMVKGVHGPGRVIALVA